MKEPWKYPRWYQRILNLYRFRRGRTIYACSSHPNASDENSGRSMREPKATIVGAIDACRLDRGDEVVVWTGHTEHGTVPCSERPMITFTRGQPMRIRINDNCDTLEMEPEDDRDVFRLGRIVERLTVGKVKHSCCPYTKHGTWGVVVKIPLSKEADEE